MAFGNNFIKKIEKSLNFSYTPKLTPVEPSLMNIQKSGVSVIPTYQENEKFGQRFDSRLSGEFRMPAYLLRQMYARNIVVRMAVDTIINEVVSAKWAIKPIDTDKELSEEDQKKQKKKIEELEHFFRHPNENNESFRYFLEKIMWDLLIFDAGVTEKVKSKDGKLKEIYAVSGDTIRVKIDKYGKLLGYYQVIEGSKEKPRFFNKDQLIYMVMNPRSNSPYGFPILNTLENMVTAFLYGESYNIKYFENNATPRGILELGAVNEAQLDRFREYWRQEHLQQPHRVMVLSNPNASEGKGGAKWIPMAMSSKDMELMKYMEWLMKMILAAFGVTPSEVGFTDGLQGAPMTGQVLQSQAFKNKTIYPMMDRVASFFTEEIIVQEFNASDLHFEFVEEKSIQEELQTAQRDMILIQSGIKTVEEIRKERGLQVQGIEQQGDNSRLDSILSGLTGEQPQEESAIVIDNQEGIENENIVDLAFSQLADTISNELQIEGGIIPTEKTKVIEQAFKELQDTINSYIKTTKDKKQISQKIEDAYNNLSKDIKFFINTKQLNNLLPREMNGATNI
jgi:HK97 family phage portal protein